MTDDILLQEQKILNANALFFDLDGTLIDTDYANFLCYKEAIEKVKKTSVNLVVNSKERITRKNIRTIVQNINDEEYSKIIEIKESLYYCHLHTSKLNNSVANILDKYPDKEVILVTNSHQRRADLLLRHFNLTDKFSKKYYGGNILGENKFHFVLSALDIDASSVFVFENDESEINAAVTAGISLENILKVVWSA